MRLSVAICLALVLAAMGAGCGSSADDERLRQEQLEAARDEGARAARLDERTREAAATAKRLERELKRLKRRRTAAADRSTGTRSDPAPQPAAGNCGGGLEVNSVTTCPFARNVRTQYYAEGEPDDVDVYSPVTGRTYTMSCTPSSPHVCTGGNNARVTFP